MVKAVKAIVQVIDLVQTVNKYIADNPNGTLEISFGDFVIGGDARKPATAPGNDPVPANTPANADAGSKIDNDPKNANKTQAEKDSAKGVVSKFGTKPGAWRFPLLQNPASVFGLLTGKDVVLFEYDLPGARPAVPVRTELPNFSGPQRQAWR